MANDGSFISEVFCDGRTFHFEAAFTARRWSATIWDEQGRPRGSIACASTAPHLQDDELEDEVCEWVHRSVRHRVGVVLDAEASVRAVNLREPVGPGASKAAAYGQPELAEDPEVLWQMVDALATKSRTALQRTRTGIAPAGFLVSAHAARQPPCETHDEAEPMNEVARAKPLYAKSPVAYRPPA
ncbi:hypothetical protein GT347_25680 [Xylophilus rhododendri]|uniref:Uncharacterized protein n=1 Tax=Xylophilus rhododendri TaxID=2697032 RepID=A0A857JAW8_9BURK|nr:hypothetical protein [Xylophilus rhododendri]QHJ01077.1 hypothetical protein GT347_25680 [Xylophilus rhododendri]